MSESATLKEAVARFRTELGELLYCAAAGNALPAGSICDITELFDSSGDVVATYCGCGRLLEREDNYCSNCGAKVPRGDVE